jgi:uncharacterized RDD family membrane protein YckC
MVDTEIMNDHQLTIHTPEGVTFHLPLAGPVSRCLAWMVDAFCLLAVFQLSRIFIQLLGLISTDISSAFATLLFFVVRTGYAIFLEWFWQGQTIGKRMLGLRVLDAHGLRLQPSQIIIRNLLRAVDSLPLFYLVGGIICLVTQHGQRLGDLAANTIVIKSVSVVPPDLNVLLEQNRYNSLKNYPHIVARLRQHVTPEEAGIALQALMRRDLLQPDARVILFNEIATHFKAKVRFPLEAVESVSNEQYVRNVVDVLFKA